MRSRTPVLCFPFFLAILLVAAPCSLFGLQSDPVYAAAATLPDAPTPNPDAAAAGDSQSAQQQSRPQPQQDPSSAPSPAPPPNAAAAPQSTPENDPEKSAQTASGQGKVAGTSNDRLFYTLPNFLTLQQTGKLPPLTAGQKFKVVALGNFDRVEFPWWGLLAAISQADDGDPAYGQGWIAYAKRYGTTVGDSSVENFMVGAVFPSILHQDPRFYQSSQGGFIHRAGYAISRIVVTRTDSGGSQFNYSEIFGAAVAASISTYTYHPRSTYLSTPTNPHLFVPSERTLANSTSTWGTQIGLDTTTILVKEFWPDVHRKLSHKSRQGPAGSPGPGGD